MTPDELHTRLLAAQSIPPPPGLAGSVCLALRAVMPPQKLAERVATLPERERRQLSEIFSQKPAKHSVRITK